MVFEGHLDGSIDLLLSGQPTAGQFAVRLLLAIASERHAHADHAVRAYQMDEQRKAMEAQRANMAVQLEKDGEEIDKYLADNGISPEKATTLLNTQWPSFALT